MFQKGIDAFPHYYVGIRSLSEIATRDDRVCVLNIFGNESREVTPVSHAFSGGNIVFGTMPGRSGTVLKTPDGAIPVYNNIAEGLEAGHRFNTAVLYLPPGAVRDGVAEAIRVNPDLRKIIILTEKVSVHDSRMIRAMGQLRGIDIFGANCLGVADSHNRVRLGGALGGDTPEEVLVPGSVAIYSNSGNFTTTIASYLLTEGWGTTTLISSGKDVYIHFAAREFIHALRNDDRSKAAVMYVEPGGYYEDDLDCPKPIIACVVGRWKARLTKAVGHAGSLAGAGDNAAAKEKWFLNQLGVEGIHTPDRPHYSDRGALVTRINHIPHAMRCVMQARGEEPDFEKRGSLSCVVWFGDNHECVLPPDLDLPLGEAHGHYRDQIEAANRQVGAIFPRQRMKDASGATLLDGESLVARVHGVSLLDACQRTVEENFVLALTRAYPTSPTAARMAGILLNAFVNLHDTPALTAAESSRAAGSSPNTALASAIGILGPACVAKSQAAVREIIERFQRCGISQPLDSDLDLSGMLDLEDTTPFLCDQPDPRADAMLSALDGLERRSIFVEFVRALASKHDSHPTSDGLLAALCATLAWPSLVRKRISKATLINMPWHVRIVGAMVGASAPAAAHGGCSFAGVPCAEIIADWGFSETAFLSLFGRRPDERERFAFNVVVSMLISNGPGTISAQGAKGAVSSDGPESTEQVHINKCYIGFLTHSGFAHGGNGHEGMTFLINLFRDTGLVDPMSPDPTIDIQRIALEFATGFLRRRLDMMERGDSFKEKIPCIGHPVFKGEKINLDPREIHVKDLLERSGFTNVFLEFFHELVHALFQTNATKNVFAVNMDAAIAATLLGMLWQRHRAGEISRQDLQSAAFTTFLFGRMLGSAAEIEDHINRGLDMDTRTRASDCTHIN